MPQWEPSLQERRLASFCRLFAAIYFIAALGIALLPLFAPQPILWSILAAGLMASLGTACLVTAAHPREGRNGLLPVLVAQLVSGALALLHWKLWALVDLLLFAATVWAFRSASPGVHSAPAREGPPPAPEGPQQKVQLGVSKAN